MDCIYRPKDTLVATGLVESLESFHRGPTSSVPRNLFEPGSVRILHPTFLEDTTDRY